MMLQPLRRLFGRAEPPPPARVPDGERYYVVGDVHGRDDLFAALVEAIERDDAIASSADTTVVLLGDLVDRGPASAGVIDRAMDWKESRKLRFLAGNHEEMFLGAFEDPGILRQFVKHGGRETILSYGIPCEEYNSLTLEELQQRLPVLVPRPHREFLASFEDMIVAGDYLFVHAGIDPSRPLEEQQRSDLLWIRDRFLRHRLPHSHIVVHGHTIFEEVADEGNRIGIDTGAYRTGRLTALILEGDTRRFLSTVEKDGRITVEGASAVS
jgi:serine/threonine protein phosphatase 1